VELQRAPADVLVHNVYHRPVPGRPPSGQGGRQAWASWGASGMRPARSSPIASMPRLPSRP
jgi:hypothetical protein